jgi:polyisoprenoid-binding protein YceI
MHAATVDVLVSKAHLEPDVAVAFAEAFDMAIGNAQLVTVPVMDTRFAAVDARFTALEAKMDARFEAFEARMNARFAEWDAKMNARFAEVDAKFAELNVRFAEIDAKIEKRTADLMRWVLLVMLSNVALSAGASAVLNFLQRAH